MSDSICVVCKKPLTKEDIDIVKAEYSDLYAQADCLGIVSLREDEQIILENRVHYECIEDLI